LARLPEICVVPSPLGGFVYVKFGSDGYWPCEKDATQEWADKFNHNVKATPAIVAAYLAGSMFGWQCPAIQSLLADGFGLPCEEYHATH
jgi:hypothetical protein